MTDRELEHRLWEYTASEQEYIKNINREFGLKDMAAIENNLEQLRERKVNKYYTVGKRHFADKIFFKRHSRFNHVMPHCHEYIEMQYVYSGTFCQSVNGKEMVLKKGDVCILDPHTIHDNQMAGEDDIILVFAMAAEVFNNTFFESVKIDNVVSNFLIRCLYEERKNRAYMYFETADYPEVRSVFVQLAKELTEESIGWETVAQGCLLMVFTYLMRIYGEGQDRAWKADEDYKMRVKVMQYIKDHYLDISLEEMAGEFGFHPNYFCGYVKRIMGRNFKDLVTEERLKRATVLLLETELSAEEVGVKCGFGNQNTFYRKFREKYGVTPKGFRELAVFL